MSKKKKNQQPPGKSKMMKMRHDDEHRSWHEFYKLDLPIGTLVTIRDQHPRFDFLNGQEGVITRKGWRSVGQRYYTILTPDGNKWQVSSLDLDVPFPEEMLD